MSSSLRASIVLAAWVLAPIAGFAGTVKTTADTGEASLRQIIADAVPGEVIDFAIESSPPWEIVLTSGEITIDKSLLILGPGADQVAISGNDASRVFVVNPGISTVLTGLSIHHGSTEGSGGCIHAGADELSAPAARIFLGSLVFEDCANTMGDGGALSVNLNTPTIVQDCRFEQNEAAYWGGAIYTHSEMTVIGTVFQGNSSGQNGGAVFTEAGAVVIDSQFLGNSTGSQGGALFNYRFSTWINDSLFEGNESLDNGGAITHQSDACTAAAVLTIAGSRITDNETGGGGGGILNSDGCAMRIRGSVIDHNRVTAGVGGGVHSATAATLDVSSSTISDNEAFLSGGGLYVSGGGNASLVNTTVSGNTSSDYGGGIQYEANAAGDMSSSTIANNTATQTGGGIAVANDVTVHMRNSIVAGNSALADATTSDCLAEGTPVSVGHNLFGLDTGCPASGTGDLTVAPVGVFVTALAPLDFTGGKGPTHALLVGSPAVDAGDPTGCKDNDAALIATDQRGVPRPVDGDGDATAICDIGAYEAPLSPQVIVDIDANGTVQPLTDGLLMLRFAFGFTGNTLINGAVGIGCKRCTAPEIEAYLNATF